MKLRRELCDRVRSDFSPLNRAAELEPSLPTRNEWGESRRPERVASELCRVTRPGGLIALANWTPGGFIGKMFAVFARHLPPPAGIPSPLLWGDEAAVRSRFNGAIQDLRLTPRIARMCFPFDPAGTVEFVRRYYGPTQRAFQALDPAGQARLRSDLVELETRHNVSPHPDETDTPSEYLEIHARRG